jgi:hypothetical protein
MPILVLLTSRSYGDGVLFAAFGADVPALLAVGHRNAIDRDNLGCHGPIEGKAAEAERERKQQKAQITSILVILAAFGALGVFGWIGSIINKVKTNAVAAATPYVTPTPYNRPDIAPTP